MQNNPLISLFGLARRCGKIAQGFDAAVGAVTKGKAKDFFLTHDAAERTRRNVCRIAEECGARVWTLSETMQQLGAGIGCAPTAVVAIQDAGFEKKARELCAKNGFCERNDL